MKFSRRKAMGVATGALIAGPQAAKEAIMSNPGMPHPFPPSSLLSGDGATIQGTEATIDPYYIENRKNELLEIINGKFNDYHLNELHSVDQMGHRKQVEINSFKSISEVYKQEMRIKHEKEIYKKNWIRDAKKDLANLLGIKK